MIMSLLSIFGPMVLKLILGYFEKGQLDKKTMKAVLTFIKEMEEKDYADQVDLDEAIEENDHEMIEWIKKKRGEKNNERKI